MKKLLIILLAAVCALATYAQDPLQGKKFAVIGDSYVRNHRAPVEETWHYKFAKKHGMEYLNYGRNGASIAYDSQRWGTGLYHRYQDMDPDLDYVVVIAGHNDWHKLDSIGGLGEFKVRLDTLCTGLIDRYPTAKIMFFTCWSTDNFEGSPCQSVVDAIKDVCGARGIPVFDAARNSGIYVTSPKFREIYFQPSKGNTDRAHLNAAGHDRFLPTAEAFILSH